MNAADLPKLSNVQTKQFKMAANRVSGNKAEKTKGKQRKTNGWEDVVIEEQDGIRDMHAQVWVGEADG